MAAGQHGATVDGSVLIRPKTEPEEGPCGLTEAIIHKSFDQSLNSLIARLDGNICDLRKS